MSWFQTFLVAFLAGLLILIINKNWQSILRTKRKISRLIKKKLEHKETQEERESREWREKINGDDGWDKMVR